MTEFSSQATWGDAGADCNVRHAACCTLQIQRSTRMCKALRRFAVTLHHAAPRCIKRRSKACGRAALAHNKLFTMSKIRLRRTAASGAARLA
jgi:hypothetical protein